MFYYVYALRSLQDAGFYVGFTGDLKRRLAEHQAGQVSSTRHRLPVELVYYEASRSQRDATRREKYLKSTWGKRFLKLRIAADLTGSTGAPTSALATARTTSGAPTRTP